MGWLILVARQCRKNFLNMQNDQRAGGLTSYHTSNFSLVQVNNKDIYIGERQRLLVSTKIKFVSNSKCADIASKCCEKNLSLTNQFAAEFRAYEQVKQQLILYWNSSLSWRQQECPSTVKAWVDLLIKLKFNGQNKTQQRGKGINLLGPDPTNTYPLVIETYSHRFIWRSIRFKKKRKTETELVSKNAS